MDIILKLLEKDNKHSDSKTEKYEVIKCQDYVNFINLLDIIQNKIFNAIFLKLPSIIKIGKSDTIEREYYISQLLNNQKNSIELNDKYKYISNKNYFIKYFCYFSCKNNIQNIITNKSICSNEGDIIKILVMKKYDLGNITNYKWNNENFYVLKELIKQIFYAFFISYINYGFIHNDSHFGNFLIKKNDKGEYSVIIIDFETSLFIEDKINNYYYLYFSYQQLLSSLFSKLNIKTKNIDEPLNYIISFLHSNNKIDLNVMFELIDNITFDKIYDIKNMIPIYNPDIF